MLVNSSLQSSSAETNSDEHSNKWKGNVKGADLVIEKLPGE